jgi:myo-inositol-1(or 4)-monophosphatase
MTPNEFEQRQRIAETVARDAGRLACGYLSDLAALAVRIKGPQNVVTEADGAVERAIVATLHAAFPGDTVLGEEGGGTPGDRCWVIDPIDGTANFARGLPHWCVSIAFVAAGRNEVGVICDPSGNFLYSARRGAGATRNGSPIRVSATADIARAIVDIGYSPRTPIDDFVRIVARLLERRANVTQCGSAALGLARVADGRLDGYAERHLYAWDALAGLLLVEEAGGCVNAFLERGALTAGNETVAATPALYAPIAGALGMR